MNKILIANRGEIACRVIRTAKVQGYSTVAVYSEADRNALHVQLADEAIYLGPSEAAQSYLDINKIIAAAHTTQADAIHPGYGFLSENAEFAQACADNNIIFIGPSASAIALMGSKQASKAAMVEAGVPCLPGYQGEEQSDATLIKAAKEIGAPLMVKASAGGGGRGMRLITDLADLEEHIRSARQEAKSAFGDDKLIVERALLNPRHIEVQVFGDTHGNVVHLGERDCSIQRRHQKVVEESPSPAVSPELRQALGEAAVLAAKACAYTNAGTVEFLLDEDGQFYFLEMNTRLQVEHPVTELITGQDLVAWQLLVAAGEPLPLQQDEIELNGHAIEVRLYAEDPSQNYLPQTGTISHWQPATGEGVRVDHGIQAGSEISAFYDPMIAKVIAYGDNREVARRRLIRALQQTQLLGLKDNRAFLEDIVRQDTFIQGQATTRFLNEETLAFTHAAPARLWAAAAILLQPATPSAQALGTHMPHRAKLQCGEQEEVVVLTQQGGTWTAHTQGDTFTVQRGSNSLIINGYRQPLYWQQQGDELWLGLGTQQWLFERHTYAPANSADAAGSGVLTAPMDGAIIAVNCEAGQTVEKGDVLVLLEAMKIEHSIQADVDGIVESVQVNANDQVKSKQILLSIAAETKE
ncbi:MAG TPA: acetyl/propionyl/methylcrotonyl-CoA carboxylase subunit alpha [Alcanivoracaceae bacterium]|nr:acetyl/propionyl/methylcrotonyl-CoA carboxylase subunit alpha [Alcanivoracaceae bacterium]